jgi:tyrosyl-tRNA synthetase
LTALQTLDAATISALVSATGWIAVQWEQRVLNLCTQSWLTESNSEAKKQIQAGAIYCNEQKITDIQTTIDATQAVNGVILLRKGKKVYKAIHIS